MIEEQVTLPDRPLNEALSPGSKLLSGQYEVVRHLSSGGFGITCLARDSLNRIVVIKECFPEAFCSRVDHSVRARSEDATATIHRGGSRILDGEEIGPFASKPLRLKTEAATERVRRLEPEAEKTGDSIPGAETSFSNTWQQFEVPPPAAGRSNRRTGRVKTRLLGFNRDAETEGDPLQQAADRGSISQSEKFPVGWLVIVEGPGTGHAFSIFAGASVMGRGDDQVIRLNFGDTSISRQNHAAIAYDEEVNKFYIGHGGKSNIIRRNSRPVLSTEELHHADLLRIGETTLRFVALCGTDFRWNDAGIKDATGV